MSRRRNKNRIQKVQNAAHPSGAVEINIEAPPEPSAPLMNGHIAAPVLHNDFAEAIGFCQPFGGQGGFPGGFQGQQVEDSTTIFENLRWYMVSNFRQLLSQAFVEIGLVQTICMVPVQDALRGGVLIKSKQLDEDEIKELTISVERDDDLGTAGWAAIWERLYGGGGILILVDDQDPESPLDIAAINENSNVEFRDVDMWELFWDKQNVEGSLDAPDDFEWFNYYAENVHRTRVMRLKGMKAPSFVRPRLRGWGMSVVEALVRSMNQYLKATSLGFEVLDEFKLDVYKIKNLINTLVSPNGTQKVKQRVQMANWQKNYQNAIVMDSEDDFDHKQLSFAGLAEAMEGIRMQVASDMRIPSLKLFGQSLSGGSLSSSSAEEMENYNAMVEGEVRQKLKWHILRMLEVKCQKLFGYVPEDLEIEFKPLRELGPKEQEDVKTQKYARVSQAKAAGEITTLEFRDICNKGHLFDIELDTTEAALNDPELGPPEEEGTEGEGEGEGESEEDDGGNKEDKQNDAIDPEAHAKKTSFKNKSLYTFSKFDKFRRYFNSPGFDRASYEADGGDEWIAAHRKAIFENPMGVDEGLWEKAKAASKKAFGYERWQFVVWHYQKNGGRFA